MSIYAVGEDAFAVLMARGLECAADLSVLKPYQSDRSSVRCYYRVGPAVMGGPDELQIMRGSYLLHARCPREAVGTWILADALGGHAPDGADQGQMLRLLPNVGWVGVGADGPYVCLDVRYCDNPRMSRLVWNETDLSIKALSDPNDNTKCFTHGALYLWVDRPNGCGSHIKPLAPKSVSRARWLAEWMGRVGSAMHQMLSVEEMEAISRLAKQWALVWGESEAAVEQVLLNGVRETS